MEKEIKETMIMLDKEITALKEIYNYLSVVAGDYKNNKEDKEIKI